MKSIWLIYLVALVLIQNKTCLMLGVDDEKNSRKFTETCVNRNFIIISTLDGILTALDMETGRKCWTVFLDREKFVSSTLSELEIYENGRRVWLVPSLDGYVFKYDNFKIQPLPIDVDFLIGHSSYLDPSTSVTGGKIKVIYGIHRLTGEIIYTCNIDGCDNSKNIPLPENILIVEEVINLVNAIDSSKAEKKWHFRVAELKIKVAHHISSDDNYAFQNDNNKNALIPSNYQEFSSFDSYKISLQNGFAGMVDKSNQNFLWLFKTQSPISDAWYIKDSLIKILDPFDKESGFFSIDMDDGKHSALLFLGSFEDKMYIKKSKKFLMKAGNYSSISTSLLYQTYSFPVCPKTDHSITLRNPDSHDLIPPSLFVNVSDHGSYFYMNFSIAENTTHCIINTSYIIQYDKSMEMSYWFGVYLAALSVTISLLVITVYQFIHEKEKVYVNTGTSSEVTALEQKGEIEAKQEFRSRFHQDFELIAILGKGGFGVVMDVKNKIDDCRYAVKRIRIHDKLNDLKYERVLREVKALAKLDHHGIVRYFNAWIEYPPNGWQEKKDEESNICDVTESSSDASFPLEIKSSHSKLMHKLHKNPLQLSRDSLLFNSVNEMSSNNQFTGYSNSQDESDSSSSSGTNECHKNLVLAGKKSAENSGNVSEDDFICFKEDLSSSVVTSYQESVNSKGDSICFVDDYNSSDAAPYEGTFSTKDSVGKQKNGETNFNSLDISKIRLQISSKSDSANDHIRIKLSKEQHKCCTDLIHLNKSLAQPLDGEIFYKLLSYVFRGKQISRNHIIESSDWGKCLDDYAVSKKKLTSLQQWLICILCFIGSYADFNYNLVITNLCQVLWDVNIRLSRDFSKIQHSTKYESNSSRKFLELCSNNANAEQSNRLKNISDKSKQKLETKAASGYLYIQMQLCKKESLRDWLNRHTEKREYKKVMEIFIEIVEAVHYVHLCGLMHRDLKPSNIYFSLEGAIKIGDFGLATSSDIQGESSESNEDFTFVHTTDIGTEFYMSPEQKLKKDYDCKTDIYSLGIILYELLVPFKTLSERCKMLMKIRRFEFPEEFKKNFRNESELVQMLLNADPKNRPSTNEIKQHPLLLKYSSK